MSPDRVPVAWDTETSLITDLDKAPPLVCISHASPDRAADLFKWDSPGARDIVAGWLETRLSVGANIGYDMAVCMRQWPELTPLIFEAYEQGHVCDVEVSAKLVDNAEGIMHKHPVYVLGSSGKPTNYSLAALTKRFTGKELDKDTWRLRYSELRDVPLHDWPEGARAYPIEDAVSTLQVFEALQLGYPEFLADQFRQARHAFWLYLVGVHGIRTDPARVARLEARLMADREERIALLSEHGLIRQQKKKGVLEWVKNTKAAKARMISAKGGFERCKQTAGGKSGIPDVSLDEESCSESGDPVLEAYAEISSLGKRLSTEIKALKLGELHCRFDSYKTTGRTGCSSPMNLQNLPRSGGERECFIPRPGFVFVDADYDMLELRTWAQACLELVGQSTLADELNEGRDVHLSTGGEILGGVSYEEMKARKKEAKIKEARQTAKPVNFMLPGGGGAARLVDAAKKDYGIILPADPEKDFYRDRETEEMVPKPGVEYARQLIAAWKRKRPEAQMYLDYMGDLVREGGGQGVIKALFVERYHGGCGYCDACNRPFQALGADVFKDAGWRITRDCWDWTRGSVLYGSRIVIPAHDQFIIESPTHIAHECAMLTKKHMVDESLPWLPDVPATTTPCLATCFSKGAEAVYDCGKSEGCTHEHCRLVPWSPKEETEERKAA